MRLVIRPRWVSSADFARIAIPPLLDWGLLTHRPFGGPFVRPSVQALNHKCMLTPLCSYDRPWNMCVSATSVKCHNMNGDLARDCNCAYALSVYDMCILLRVSHSDGWFVRLESRLDSQDQLVGNTNATKDHIEVLTVDTAISISIVFSISFARVTKLVRKIRFQYFLSRCGPEW